MIEGFGCWLIFTVRFYERVHGWISTSKLSKQFIGGQRRAVQEKRIPVSDAHFG